MKQLIILSILAIIIGLSCKKGSSTPTAANTISIKATFDGKEQTFNVNAKASLDTSGPFYMLIITGQQTTNIASWRIKVQTMPKKQPPAINTYTNVDINTQMEIYLAQDSTNQSYETDLTGASPSGTLTITSLTDTHVKGTFSGVVLATSSASQPQKVITNGTFDVDVQH